MKLNFKYSLDNEIKRVSFYISKLSWYKEHGYNKIKLPNNLESLSIETAVKKEYSEARYEEEKNKLEKEWERFEISRLEKSISSLHIKVKTKYDVILTQYGTSGSYRLPNTIVVNFLAKDKVKIILHEMMHLSMEELFNKKISHETKEAIIDLLCNNFFSEVAS